MNTASTRDAKWWTGTPLALALCLLCAMSFGQDSAPDAPDLEAVTDVSPETSSDAEIQARIEGIFEQIETLGEVAVTVRQGVVTLSGSVSNERFAERALELASRLDGVITVEDHIERTLDVEGNVRPVVDSFTQDVDRWFRAWPLVLLALVTFALVAFAGHLLARWSSLWGRIAPNGFLAALMAQAVRVVAIVIGLVVALNLVGATALMGTILGSAGVLGLAIGFAVRDTLENYISSIMLSLRQPFRANDYVVIDKHEGKVVRLTSRATVLMTLDGNQLRIPNSQVFKAVILNYTRNPQRRFDFELGIDASDDPVAAMKTGLDAISALDFVLDDPGPNAVIKAVGDSNIVLTFMAWVNQETTGFGKARSLAIRSAMRVLEEQGFTLPEPIYRLRFDTTAGKALAEQAATVAAPVERDTSPAPRAPDDESSMDVRPDTDLENMVNEERTQDTVEDLLDGARPIE